MADPMTSSDDALRAAVDRVTKQVAAWSRNSGSARLNVKLDDLRLILSALTAPPSEEMVEAGARAMALRHVERSTDPLPRGYSINIWVDERWQHFSEDARAVLAAALGVKNHT